MIKSCVSQHLVAGVQFLFRRQKFQPYFQVYASYSNTRHHQINGLLFKPINTLPIPAFYHADVSASKMSTIYALSSGHGKCGVAVIRISGSQTVNALKTLTRKPLPGPRTAVLRHIYHPQTDVLIDKALIIYFPEPKSFTGEAVCELHVHGGPAVVSAVLNALSSLSGLKHAEPGDFTKRSFLNGKLDLTEVEGLGDLIHAETEAQRLQAIRQMEGSLSKLYLQWKRNLLKSVAHLEAYIDFSEDELIEYNVIDEVTECIGIIEKEIKEHLADNRCGERLRDGVRVVILGKPNVGKSSLLNVLSNRPAAIVSPIPGTTRDVVETALNFGGYPILLSDTAGIRDSKDEIELEGISRAWQRIGSGDINLIVMSAEDVNMNSKEGLSHSIKELLRNFSEQSDVLINKPTMFIINKIDLVVYNEHIIPPTFTLNLSDSNHQVPCVVCLLSCVTEKGLNDFLQHLKTFVVSLCISQNSGNPSLTQARHRQLLNQALDALDLYEVVVSRDIVLAAHHVQTALRCLGKITGQVTSDEILDVIFRDFCIGK